MAIGQAAETQKAAMTAAPPRNPHWTWDIPEHFNIGAACTDAHLGSAVAERLAIICDGDPFTSAGDRRRRLPSWHRPPAGSANCCATSASTRASA